jgi:chromosomal replication initiator protein
MNLTVRTITNEVADYYKVDILMIYSMRRNGNMIKYKHISIYLIKMFTDLTMAAIGYEFPGRNGYLDHATVLHAINAVQDQYDTNKIYRKEIDEIRSRLEMLVEDCRIVDEEVFQQSDFFTVSEIQTATI